ncbi:MAG: O-antigen ligase family protein [Chitinophagales bacterium]
MNVDRKVLLFLFLLICIGLYYSIFLLSVVPYLLLLLGLSNKDVRKKLRSFISHPKYYGLSLILLIYVLSGINSENTSNWLGRVNSNLIFLVIPLAFHLIGPLKKKYVNAFLAIYVVVNLVISIKLLVGYLLNFEEINDGYLRGKTIVTPIIHIWYSHLVAIAVLFSIYLTATKFYFVSKWERYLYGFAALFLMVFIHVLAVRTGLLALYLTLILSGCYYIFRTKKYKLGLAGFAALVLIFAVAYTSFPSFKNKMSYVKWDISTALDEHGAYHNSDRIRIYSILNGWILAKEHPFFGVGVGDIEEATDKKFEVTYPDLPMDLRYSPINQVVFSLACFGFLGMFAFYTFLCIPLFYFWRRHPLVIPFYMLTFSTFIGEQSIELIVGKTTFLMVVSVLVQTKEEEKLLAD